MNGILLLELQAMSINAPEFFFSHLKQDMNFSLLDMLTLSRALKSLNSG